MGNLSLRFDYKPKMDNYRQSLKNRNLLLGFIIILVISVSACTPVAPAPIPPPKVTPTQEFLVVAQQFSRIEGEQLRDGTLTVVINARNTNHTLNVIVDSDEGIIFSPETLTPAEVEMLPFESRRLLFPYQVNQRVPLSGEYITRVTVRESGATTGTIIKNFVLVQDQNSVRLLSSQGEFDKIFDKGYVLTNTKFTIIIVLDSAEQPARGVLTVKIPSLGDGYNCQVVINVKGGILFEEASQVSPDLSRHTAVGLTGPIAMQGSRLLRFPFVIDPSSTGGTYAFTISVKGEGKKEVTDYFPVAIQVLSSTVKSNESWLVTQNIPLPLPTSTPTPIPTPTPTPTPKPCILGIFCQ